MTAISLDFKVLDLVSLRLQHFHCFFRIVGK
jgi:hypothetical protein